MWFLWLLLVSVRSSSHVCALTWIHRYRRTRNVHTHTHTDVIENKKKWKWRKTNKHTHTQKHKLKQKHTWPHPLSLSLPRTQKIDKEEKNLNTTPTTPHKNIKKLHTKNTPPPPPTQKKNGHKSPPILTRPPFSSSPQQQELRESFNYGLFCPPQNGRAGKFLDEERPLGDYPLTSPIGYLEVRPFALDVFGWADGGL